MYFQDTKNTVQIEFPTAINKYAPKIQLSEHA